MSKIQEQFRNFTQLFAVDGYKFIQMERFLESIEVKENKTQNEIDVLHAFTIVSRLCKVFVDRNPQ